MRSHAVRSFTYKGYRTPVARRTFPFILPRSAATLMQAAGKNAGQAVGPTGGWRPPVTPDERHAFRMPGPSVAVPAADYRSRPDVPVSHQSGSSSSSRK